MRVITLPGLAAAFALTTSGAALAAPPPLQSGASLRLAVADAPPEDRTTYTAKADQDVGNWRVKLHDFGEKAEVQGKQASKATREGLETAWSKTEEAGRQLKTATVAGWDDAKRAYEKASRELSDTWNKVASGNN